MKKSFGQHLLIDKNYLKKIINAVDLSSNDTVLEIGSGSGLVTIELAKIVKKVIAVENEKYILQKLKENIAKEDINNVEVVEKDFLRLDLLDLIKSSFISSLIVVGNIPYNITSKILIKLFGELDNPSPHFSLLKKVYLMLQLEVAQRIVSKPGTKSFSPFTILTQYFTNPEILFRVPKTAFYPIPKVESAFVLFNPKKQLQRIENPTLVKNIIRTCFQQKRKKIINSLVKLYKDKNLIKQAFNKCYLDYNLRPEELDLDQYLLISHCLPHGDWRNA